MPPEEIDVQPDSSTGTDETPASSPETVDPLQEAIDKGDYGTYERLSNAKDIERGGPPPKFAARESGKSAPASQPAKPQESPQGRPPKPHAREDRIQKLLAENSALRKQIEGKPAEPGVPQASPPAQPKPEATAPKPAPEPPKDDPMPILDHKPDGSRWKNYDEYSGQLQEWWLREGGRRAIAAAVEQQQKAAEARVNAEWQKRVDEVAKDPDYPDYVKIAFNENVHVNLTARGFLLTSEHGPKMLYHLGKNPGIAAKLVQADPYSTARFLTLMEAAFNEKPAPPKKEEPTPTRRTTRMPPPPTDIGARGSSQQDELDAAVERGDTAAYIRLANERDIRNARGR